MSQKVKRVLTVGLIIMMVFACFSASISLLRMSPVSHQSSSNGNGGDYNGGYNGGDNGGYDNHIDYDKCEYRINVCDSNNAGVDLAYAEPDIYLTENPGYELSVQGIINANVWCVLLPGTGEYTFTLTIPGFETFSGSIIVTPQQLGTSQVMSINLTTSNVGE